MHSCTRVVACAVLAAALLITSIAAAAQAGAALSGRLVNSVSGDSIAGAIVVIEELRRGYRLGERLLRPAMVKVAQA